MLLTFPAYVATIRGIIGDRIGILLACAFPGILANAMVGQNGFVTAALFGGALICLERRPLVAGCLIGLLSFKPHLGILFPIALDRRRALARHRGRGGDGRAAVRRLVAGVRHRHLGGVPARARRSPRRPR